MRLATSLMEANMRTRSFRQVVLSMAASLAPSVLAGQGPNSVPAQYADLYRMLGERIATFDGKLGPAPARGDDVAWGAELLTANCNRGRALLDPRAAAGMRVELTRLQSLGLRAVTVCIGFPLLYKPFLAWNGDPDDYDRFVAFYRDLAGEVHRRGMKLIVETSVLFPGVYSQGSGLKLREYYATLDPKTLAEGRAQVARTIVAEVKPDYLNLGSEPDTQARLTGRLGFATPAANAGLVQQLVQAIRPAHAAGTRIGAGVGTWSRRADAYVQALCATDIDFVDLHVYPVNGDMLERLIPLTEQAARCGKPVAISEAWLQKERDAELPVMDAAADPTVFSRDVFAFWSPLDQAFLAALVKFTRAKQLLYLSPFWSRYFWAYLDYSPTQGLGRAQLLQAANRAAAAGLLAGSVTGTGRAYQQAIQESEASGR